MIAHARHLLPIAFRMVPGSFWQQAIQPDTLWSARGYCFSAQCSVLPIQRMLQLGAFGRSRLPVATVQSARCYRVKKDTNMMSEEEFICKITKLPPSDASTLKEYQRRLKSLVKKGCKRYELVECPEILRLTEFDINRRIERLNTCGQSSISMPLLMYAKPESSNTTLKSSLRRYLKLQNGRLNRVDEIRMALQCTDDEMMDILRRNPRLVGRRKRKFIVEKVNCLLGCGAVIQDIRSNTNLLNNKTLTDVESRAKRLFDLGYNDPLPIGVIGRDDDDFESIVARLEKQRRLHPTSHHLESREIIARIPDYANRKLHVVKPKVDFLLSRGYSGEEIIEFPSILESSLEAIHDAVIFLQSYHLGSVSLETCHKYVTKKRVTSRRRSTRKMLAKVLGCRSTELMPIPKDVGVVFSTEATLQMNYDFLLGVGFANTDLRQLPIILENNSDVLRLHWELIQTKEAFASHFKAWKEEKRKLLHLLQFAIEKESNFCRVSVVDERKRVEDSEAESVDYEAQEFSESEQETHESLKSVRVNDAMVRGGQRVELDSADLVDTDKELDPCVEHNLDVDLSVDRDGALGKKQERENFSDASTSSDEELSVKTENSMAESFPSSSAQWTSRDR